MKRTSTLLLCFVAAVLATSVQAQTTNTNTVVRFRIGYGTTLYGNVDIELFNDKPITVTNFLKYLQRGDYANSILHDLRPGFALVGGLGTVINPYSPANFDALYRIPQDPSITNEFHVGTPRSNVFGTLAMKKETTSPNSATSQWLINLGNNTDGTGVTNLDTYLDGFTVFGQVIAGANVLQAFNQFTYSGGIADQLNATYLHFCRGFYMYPGGEYQGFDALPVGFSGAAYLNCIQYNDLFTVQMSMLSGPDVAVPKVAITSPKNKASVTNETLTVTGTASDNIGVTSVRVYLNTNAAVAATFTNGNWSTIVSNVPPGTNTLLVEAIDAAGNRSQSQISFFRSVRVPLSLTVVGDGTISGAVDGQMLELTRAYTITAKPKPGNLFTVWTGSVTSATPSIKFVMEPDTAFIATFATNHFPTVSGVYNGLFHEPNQVAQLSAGAVNLVLSSSGGYSAKLMMNGKTYRFSGSFSPDGAETNLVDRPGTNDLLLRLNVDLTNGTEQITGTITNNQTTAINANFAWQADLRADRAAFDGRVRVSPDAGKYTLLVPRDTNSPAGPDGDGFGTVTVSTKGALSFNGTLADGTKATQKTTVSKDGYWPLYVPLYQDKGFLFGWLAFTNDTTAATDFSGLATWIKQRQLNVRYYLGGFTNETTLLGSRYVAPTTNRVVAITNGLVTFAGGDLASSFTNNVRLEANNKVVNLSTNKLTLTVVKGTGLLNGTVTPPGSTRSQAYKGAVLQKQNRGGGFILGITESGGVEFKAAE